MSARGTRGVFPPKSRAVLAGDPPRKVTILHKVSGVDAYHVRYAPRRGENGSRAVVKSSQLQARPEAPQLLPRQTR